MGPWAPGDTPRGNPPPGRAVPSMFRAPLRGRICRLPSARDGCPRGPYRRVAGLCRMWPRPRFVVCPLAQASLSRNPVLPLRFPRTERTSPLFSQNVRVAPLPAAFCACHRAIFRRTARRCRAYSRHSEQRFALPGGSIRSHGSSRRVTTSIRIPGHRFGRAGPRCGVPMPASRNTFLTSRTSNENPQAIRRADHPRERASTMSRSTPSRSFAGVHRSPWRRSASCTAGDAWRLMVVWAHPNRRAADRILVACASAALIRATENWRRALGGGTFRPAARARALS